MTAVGGSIVDVSLSGREFGVPADAEIQRKKGGWENEVLSNGNGTARLIKTRSPLALDGLVVEIDDDRNDQDYLQDLADQNSFWDATITFANNVTWGCRAQIVGELNVSSMATTATISLKGPGKFERQ